MDRFKTTAPGRFFGFLICSLVFCSTAPAVAAPGIELVKKVNGHDAATCVMVYGDSTLIYTYEVMNTGDEELSNISVDDNILGHIGDIALLGVGSTVILRHDTSKAPPYSLVEQLVENIGTVTGTGTSQQQVSHSDTACARVPPKNPDPDILLIKSVNGNDANTCPGADVAGGAVLTYTFTVVNTGSETLEDISIDDNVLGHIGDISALASGASVTLSHTSSTAPAAGLVNQQVQNIATATGTGEKSLKQVSDTDPACINVPPVSNPTPAITLIKKVNGDDANTCPGIAVDANSSLAYTFAVTNTGTEPLVNISVDDDILGHITTIASLGIGNTITLIHNSSLAPAATATQQEVKNTATATGTGELSQQQVTATDPACIAVPPTAIHPLIRLIKKVNGDDANTCPGTEVTGGMTLTYTFEVTNTGTEALININVDDNILGHIGTITFLGIGNTATLTHSSSTAPAAGLVSQQVQNTATAIGTGETSLGQVSDTDPACINVPPVVNPNPDLTLIKKVNGDDANTCPGVGVTGGATLLYTFEVTNTGNEVLINISVDDDILGHIGDIASLGVGVSTTLIHATSSAPAATNTEQEVQNIATAIGTAQQTGGQVSDADSACINVPSTSTPSPAVQLIKKVNANFAHSCPGLVVTGGASLTYTFEVTNTGSETLIDLSVDDTILGHIGDIASLAVGASATLSHSTSTAPATGGATQEVYNVATVNGTGLISGQRVSDADPACISVAPNLGLGPDIQVIKKVNGNDANECPGIAVDANSPLTYTFEVINIGTEALTNVSIDDDILGHIGVIASLAAGQSVTLTHGISSAPPAGPAQAEVLNVVTASGTGQVTGQPVSDTDSACISVPPGAAGGCTAGEPEGYVLGDPAPGKLLPYYKAEGTLATIIGFENVSGTSGGVAAGSDIGVHIVVFDEQSTEVLDFDLCLSSYDFGYIVLQEDPASAGQLAEANQGQKVAILSVKADFIPSIGYVTFKARRSYTSTDGSCTGTAIEDPFAVCGPSGPLTTWAVLQDVGTGFYGTEIPTTTALVDSTTGAATGAVGALGLIPTTNTVIARFDVNPNFDIHTEIFIWLQSNSRDVAGSLTRTELVLGYLQCEDELQISTTIPLPNEINIIDPATLGGIGQCIQAGQYRGVLRFQMPDHGFLWSHITQEGEHFRENFLGYNLDCNEFVACPP